MLLSTRVENLSLADAVVAQSTQVLVAFDSDADVVMNVLQQAALAQPRVLKDPAPSVQLSQFAVDGLEFTLVYWINDLHKGQGNLRSDVNLAVLRALREQGVVMAAVARATPVSASVHPAPAV
jgi:small-conductance mechanosensitive channel